MSATEKQERKQRTNFFCLRRGQAKKYLAPIGAKKGEKNIRSTGAEKTYSAFGGKGQFFLQKK